ncbi:hypothetical protein M885DRAFT_510926 [Pelagophyceae sp. CCMP2097]|nr:hypothetical protein M885DRAFT_510926 [Pelagophyceae sp. CCMP2097]
MRGFLALCAWRCAAFQSSRAPAQQPAARLPVLCAGAFPEPAHSPVGGPRTSLVGLWRLRREEVGLPAVDDVIVKLTAAGTFTAWHDSRFATGDSAAASVALAEKLKGRWYSDGADRELRLARFERQSPVEWYTGAPADAGANLGIFRGSILEGAHEPEWVGKFSLSPLWPDFHEALPPPVEAPPAFDAGEAGAVDGRWDLVFTTTESVAYDVRLYPNRTWETVGGFDGSESSREGGFGMRPAVLESGLVEGLRSLERAAARSTRDDKAFLSQGLEAAPPRTDAKLCGTWNVFDDEDDLDLFSGAPGRGHLVFLWARRFGTSPRLVGTGVSYDSDMLFVGELGGAGAANGLDASGVRVALRAAGVTAVGWNADPCFIGTFSMRRAAVRPES